MAIDDADTTNAKTTEIHSTIDVSSSVELWREIENRYDQTNGAKLYKIQKGNK